MASFTTAAGGSSVPPTMHVGGHRRLHLAGVGSDKASVTVASSNPDTVAVRIGGLFDGPKGIYNVELTAKKNGSAQIEARLKGAVVAKVAVVVVDPLVLPSATGEEGMLARLLLSENKSPDDHGYNASQSVTSMRWMRVVLANRLANHPAQFNAAGAKSIASIVTAKGQFEGFSHYPILGATQASRLARILAIANDDTDARQAKYATFVANALAEAKSKTLIADPCPTGLYGWKTVNSDPPKGNFVPWGGPLSGNQFFTLDAKKN